VPPPPEQDTSGQDGAKWLANVVLASGLVLTFAPGLWSAVTTNATYSRVTGGPFTWREGALLLGVGLTILGGFLQTVTLTPAARGRAIVLGIVLLAGAAGVACIVLLAQGSSGHPRTGASTDSRDTLFGKTLTNKYQAIDVPDLPQDLRFVAWPPPAWVARVAAAWKPGAKLAGMEAHVDGDGMVTLDAGRGVVYHYVADGCYSGWGSGQRNQGTLNVTVDSAGGRVRVGVVEWSNTADRPLDSVCPLPQAIAAMVKAGRLPAGSAFDVRNYDPPMAAQWDFSTDRFARVLGSVDIASCAVVR